VAACPETSAARRKSRRAALPLTAGGLALLLLLALAPAALAHATLVRSEPAANAVLSSSPSEIHLWMSEPLVTGISTIQILDSQGQPVTLGQVMVGGNDGAEMWASLPPLGNGTYLVSWRAFSAVDGHTTEGTFPFSVGVASATSAASASSAPPASPVTIAWRWLLFLSQAAVAGMITFRWWVWGPAAQAVGEAAAPAFPPPFAQRYLRLMLGLAALGATGLFVRQVLAASGGSLADLFTGRLPIGALLSSRLGTAWFGRLATLGGLAIISADIVNLDLRPAARGAVWPRIVHYGSLWLAALLLYFTTASSHSAALTASSWFSLPEAADWTHLAATAMWVGGLLPFLVVFPGAVRRIGNESTRTALVRELVFRYSTLAAFGVGLMLLSGIYLGELHVGGWDRLFDSSYGQTLLLKVSLVAVMMALGGLNLVWVKPGLEAEARRQSLGGESQEGEAPPARISYTKWFWRLVSAEAVTGILVLAAAGWLTELPRGADASAIGPGHLRLAGQADDLRLSLTLSPAQQGPNQFDVRLSPAADGTVSLRFSSLDRALGSTEVLLDETAPGEYGTNNATLNLAGDWQIEAIVRRPDAYDAYADFEVFVRPDGRISTGRRSSDWAQLFVPFAGLFAGLALVAGGTAWLIIAGRAARSQWSYYGLLAFAFVAALAGGRTLLRFFTDTTPASTLTNPAQPDAVGLVTGQTIYQEKCLDCHGKSGGGDGPLAATLDPLPPQPFATGRAAHAQDGDLYWWTQNGVLGSAMPAFRSVLSDGQAWNVVNYIKTLGAGSLNPSAGPTAVPLPPTPTPPGGLLPPPGQSEDQAIDLLDKIELAMDGLHTLREVQTITDDTGLSQTFTYKYAAPNRLAYTSSTGQEVVVIGNTQYFRVGDAPWQSSTGSQAFTFPPTHGYTQNAVGARYEGAGTLDGKPVEIVAFADSTLPAAYRLWVDADSGLILQLVMEAPNHHMVSRYDQFDAPVDIEAPEP
jgi:copper transport protein